MRMYMRKTSAPSFGQLSMRISRQDWPFQICNRENSQKTHSGRMERLGASGEA